MQLRPYQANALKGVQDLYRAGRRRVLLVAPTGSGKSALMRHMLERTAKRTLILCHREELRDMIAGDLTVPFGTISGNSGVPPEPVHLGMMQTVARRLDRLPRYDWVISDEAHLAMCPTWRGIIQHYGHAWHLGMSATPCRLDGVGLGAEYEQIVYGPSIRELTERSYLAPLRVYAPSTHGRQARKSGADFNLTDAAQLLDRPGITGDVLGHFKRLARDRQAIVFACSRSHAESVAREFTAAGVPAVNVDGSMTSQDQARRVGDFRARRLQALVNVDLLTTGFDCPQIECAVFLRPTQSLALYLQMVGRILRISEGKRDALLLDHVGNAIAHGMPDADREWTLDGRLRRAAPLAVAMCPSCFAVHSPAPRCPSCGNAYAPAASARRPPPEQRPGELEELTPQRLEWLRSGNLATLIAKAKGRADLDDIRKARGFKPGWTHMQLQLRKKNLSRRFAA